MFNAPPPITSACQAHTSVPLLLSAEATLFPGGGGVHMTQPLTDYLLRSRGAPPGLVHAPAPFFTE